MLIFKILAFPTVTILGFPDLENDVSVFFYFTIMLYYAVLVYLFKFQWHTLHFVVMRQNVENFSGEYFYKELCSKDIH